MNTAQEKPNGLTESAARWRSALRATDTGPLVIAEDVIKIANEWEIHRSEAGNLDCTSWLRLELGAGRTLAFFQRRARAVEKLGEACKRVLHHQVAVWLASHVEGDSQRKKAMWSLMSATKKQRGNCLTLAQAKPIVFRALGVKSETTPKTCSRCEILEALLLDNGIKIET